MRFNSEYLTTKFNRTAEQFLCHVLSTSTEFLDSVDKLLQTCNEARRASDQAIYNVLGWEPASGIKQKVGNLYSEKDYPSDLRFGGIKGEHLSERQYNLGMSVEVSDGDPGLIHFFNSKGLWDCYVPKWAVEPQTLAELNQRFKHEIPEDFVHGYDEQGENFRIASGDLTNFLADAETESLTAEHLMFLAPNLKLLFPPPAQRKLYDAFKRRPRKIARMGKPSILLKQMLAVLTSAKDVLDIDKY